MTALKKRMAPGERRTLILDSAETVFLEKGWDNTTLNDVLHAAQISKGGFYHHFESKEDLLESLIVRFTQHWVKTVADLKPNGPRSALVKLNALLTSSAKWRSDNAEKLKFFIATFTRAQNDALFYKVSLRMSAITEPVIKDLILEGVQDGYFSTPCSDATAQVITLLPQGRRIVFDHALALARKGHLDQANTHIQTRLKEESLICERLLGLPDDSVALHQTNYEPILRALIETETFDA